MGCVTSKKDINDLHPNIFQVSNVDDFGNRLSSGRLEINDTEFVLYQRHKEPIRWPIKTLRRYGYEREVFSFETGRRCPIGPGIYAFSCTRADKLFDYVQSHIQIRNDDTLSRDTAVTRTVDNLEPHPRLSVNNGPSRLSSVESGSPSPPLNNDYPPPYIYYVNDPMHRFEEPDLKPVASPVSPTVSPESEEEAISPVYMNVGGGTVPTPVEEETNHCYMNLVVGTVVPPRQPSKPPPEQLRTVNYIVLDLDASNPPPPPSPGARPLSEEYATIDFNKTVALSHSVNPEGVDEGSRKTRHNSATPRQSTSLSD